MNDLRKYMNILNEDFSVQPIVSEPISTDDDYYNNEMMQSKLLQILENANTLFDILKSGKEVPSWALSKVDNASENLEGVRNFMLYNDEVTRTMDLTQNFNDVGGNAY